MSEETINAIARGFIEGRTLRALAEAFSVGITDIYWALGRANVPLRRRRGTHPAGNRDLLAKQLLEGLRLASSLAKEHGITRERVYQIARQIGATAYRRGSSR